MKTKDKTKQNRCWLKLKTLKYFIMSTSVNFLLVRTVFGSVLGMFYFGYNTGAVNAPEAAIKKFANQSYHQHYGSLLDNNQVQTLFTVITSAFIGNMICHSFMSC